MDLLRRAVVPLFLVIIVTLLAANGNGFLSSSRAQEPIIVETDPPTPTPKPKPRRPQFRTPQLLWKVNLGRIDGTPIVDGDQVFVGAGNNTCCLAPDGAVLWKTDVGSIQGAPASDKNFVYVGTDRGLVYALRRATGKIQWKFATEGNATVLTTPALTPTRVIIEATDNNVYALASSNGQLKWRFNRPDGSLGYSAPLVADDTVYVAGEATLYALDVATGEERWKTFLGGKSQSSPFLAGQTLYLGGDGTGLTALNRNTGDVITTFSGKSTGDWFGPPLAANTTIYVSTYRRFLYAVEAMSPDAVSANLRWSYRLPGSGLTRPALDAKRGALYVTSGTFADNPTLTALNARSGKRLWEYRLGDVSGSPVIAGDRLYVGSTTGFLYAFALK